MRTYKTILAAAAFGASALFATAGHAVSFDVSGANSDVSLDASGGFVSGCLGSPLPDASCVGVELATDLETETFDLVNVGDSHTFDFLTFTSYGVGFYDEFDITATLAFDVPTVSDTVGNGDGGIFFSLGGFVVGGTLDWSNLPTMVAFGNGGLLGIDFEGGTGLFLHSPVTTTATVTLLAAPIPLPASGFLLLAGLGGVFGLRRRKKLAV